MSTLTLYIIMYLAVSIGIGLYAARRVQSSKDYVAAGRTLPLVVIIATVFAMWFGSETVLGTPSTFLDEGLSGIVTDPFGASACLIFVGIFFAARLYRLNLLTIGDFYRRKYGRTVEVLISIAICISYLGWVSAQITAMGLVFGVLSDGKISPEAGMLIGVATVLVYTVVGGMYSVALTNLVQMVVICVGMLVITVMMSGMIDGGAATVIAHAADAQKFDFWPMADWGSILAFTAAFLTMALGSIPQQDVFQRIMSAKDEQTASRGAVLGGSMYLVFAFIPVFLVYAVTLIDPASIGLNLTPEGNSQLILPEFVMSHLPLFAQVLFFGALLSAIMATTSGSLLAPAVLFAENILKPMLPKMDDQHFLHFLRASVFGFTLLVTLYAYLSYMQGLSIFEMVENAYMVTLCGAFVPLAFGLYWKRANVMGGTLSILMGIFTWMTLEAFALNIPEDGADLMIPPQLAGLAMAIVGMIIGGYFGKIDHRHEGPNQTHQDHPNGQGVQQNS